MMGDMQDKSLQHEKLHDKEIELKFNLPDPGKSIQALREKAVFKAQEHQKDLYYTPSYRNFLAEKHVSEWLRIRESDAGDSICYKDYHKKEAGAKTVHCDEFETRIDDAAALKKIFSAIGIRQIAIVNKKRSIFNFKQAEIAIDIVDELGAFLEIEAKGDFGSVDEAKAYLHATMSELGIQVGEQDFVGYPYLLLKKRGLV